MMVKKMNSDVSKELLRKINKSFTLSYQKSEKVRKLLLAIKSKNCDYLKAMEYAEEVGKILAEAYMKNLSSDVLPDGKMYYDIASAILNPTLENNYGLISSYVCGAMDVMNEKAGINVKARKPSYNASKTLGLIKKVSDAEHFDDVKTYLNEPVITNALSIVDEGARTNADLHYSMGYKPVIVRRASFGCCKWCRGLAGTQEYYPSMNRDIFRRHQNCRCTVIYDPRNSDGKVQDVWSKNWNKNSSVLHGLSADDSDSIVQKHKPPIFLKTINFNDEKEISKTLLEFEKEAVYEKIETACIITSSGDVYKCFGTNKAVYPDYDLGDELYGAIVSHNHPIDETDFSFSSPDRNMFSHFNLIILRGCDEKYVYELSRKNLTIDELPDNWTIYENYLHCSNIYKAQEMKVGYRRWKNENK